MIGPRHEVKAWGWWQARRRLAAAVQTVRAHQAEMVVQADASVYGTRRRTAALMLAGFAALAGLLSLVSSNALAVNFTTTNTSFRLYSNYLQGESAAAFLSRNTPQSGDGEAVAEIGIKTAKLAGLCAIATEKIPVIGDASLMILAGSPVRSSFTSTSNTTVDGAGNPITYDANGLLSGASAENAVTATNLFVNTPSLAGYGNLISGMNLGQSADTAAGKAGIAWPVGQAAPSTGGWGLSAERLNVGGLNGSTYGVNLQGQITLPQLKLKVLPGAKTQADCPGEA